MVLCIHIQTHTAPEQVHRLVRLLVDTSRSAVITVSHDRTGPPLDRVGLEALGDVFVVDSEGGYGDWSHIQRWLDCLDVLDSRGVEWDWITNITGQDLPLKPVAAIEAELGRSGVDGFVEHFDVLSAESPWGPRRGRNRYWYRYRRVRPLSARASRCLRPLHTANLVQPWVRCDVRRGALAVGRRVPPPFGPDLRCYGGSLYVTLTRRAADDVRAAVRDRPELVEHFRHTLSPSEAFFQTVLCNRRDRHIVDDHRRYFDFQGGRQHPRSLGRADVAPALASGKDFARKWDARRVPDAVDHLETAVRAAARG